MSEAETIKDSMRKEIDLYVERIWRRLHPIRESVWRATVESYEAQGLQRSEAYKPALAACDLVCMDAAAKFASELGALPDVIEEIAEEALTRAFG